MLRPTISLLLVSGGGAFWAAPREALPRAGRARSTHRRAVAPLACHIAAPHSHPAPNARVAFGRLSQRLQRLRRRRMAQPLCVAPLADENIADADDNKTTVELLTCASADGVMWAGVGLSPEQLGVWLSRELGEDAAEIVARCEAEMLSLKKGATHRRLRRLWRGGRFILHDCSLRDLAERGARVRPVRTFTRELSVLVRRAPKLEPSRDESAAIREYIAAHSGLDLGPLTHNSRCEYHDDLCESCAMPGRSWRDGHLTSTAAARPPTRSRLSSRCSIGSNRIFRTTAPCATRAAPRPTSSAWCARRRASASSMRSARR